MNLKKIFIIYKKELLDLLRDKRTVVTSIILPIVLYPMIMIGFSSMMSRQETKLEQKTMTAYLHDTINDENTASFRERLEAEETLQIMNQVPTFNRQTYLELIEDKSIQTLIEIQDSISDAGFQIYQIKISYDKTKEESELTYKKIKEIINKIEDEFVEKRLAKIQVQKEILNAVDLKEENIAPPEQMLGFALGKFLPYLLIIITISSASVASTDLVAGEKERGTLETILVSAARRSELVVGKYLTIITISIITVLLNLFSMYISFQHIIKQAGVDTGGFQLPLANFALILIIMLPLLTFFSAILLSLSTYSRNAKEAHSYQTPLMFAAIMLSMVSFLPGFELNLGFALIPIVNYSLLIRDIMLNNFNTMLLFVVVGWTLLFDFFAVKLSIYLFNNESILFRKNDQSLKFWGKNKKKNILSPQFAIIFFILIILALYYLGGSWQMKDLMSGLIKTQLIIFLLPVLLLLRFGKLDTKKVLQLQKTRPLNFLLVLISALPLIILAAILGQIINLFYPVSESYLKAMEELVNSDISLLSNIFIVAVLPGICEEIFSRGYLLKAFLSKGKWNAIIISGILFGVMHLDIFGLIPKSLLGIWLGYLFVRTGSIFIPMFAHFLNNAFAILISRFGDQIPIITNYIEDGIFPYWMIIPTIAVLYFIINAFENFNFRRE